MDTIIIEIQDLITSTVASGGILIVLGIIIGTVAKATPWLKDHTDYIPLVNTLLGALFALLIPDIFNGSHIIVKGIMGAMCGLMSSFVYDKILKPFRKETDNE